MQKSILIKISAAVLFASICCLNQSCNTHKPETTNIGISDEYLYFDADHSNKPQIITLTGVDTDWGCTVNTEAVSWLHAAQNKAGENSLTVQVSLNTSPEEREGNITITSGDATKTIRISQGASTTDAGATITESLHNGYSCYFGDYFGLGIGMHSLVFAPDGARFINPESGYEIKNGIQLIVGLTTEFYKNNSNFRIKSGKYSVSEDNTVPGTIISGNNDGQTAGSQVQIYKDGKINDIKLVKQGSLEITYDGETSIFTFNFMLDNGKKFIAEYRGDFKIRSLLLSTLTKDCDVTNLTGGEIDFLGQDYISELNNWDISLISEGLQADPDSGFAGNGDFINISLLTPTEITDGIPNGQYEICFDDKPYSAISGFLKENYFIGCWYLKITENSPAIWAPVISGNVDIRKAGNNYIIKLNGADDRSNRIKAAFNGSLTFADDAKNIKSQFRYSPSTQRIAAGTVGINPISAIFGCVAVSRLTLS